MPYFKPFPRFVFGGASKFRSLLNKMSSTIEINQENSPVFAADNMILIGKTAGFLRDDDFVRLANKYFLGDELHSSIIWRIQILAWAIDSCKNLEGDLIEFGCYDGIVADFLIDYNKIAELNKIFYLYDVFDNPPTARAEKHSPDLYSEVKKRMSKHSFVRVIPGLLPGSFKDNASKKLAFVHIDLNCADTETDILKLCFDRIVPGGILILDDFGFMGYEDQYFKEKEFFKNIGYSVVELPTGQGMVIKR